MNGLRTDTEVKLTHVVDFIRTKCQNVEMYEQQHQQLQQQLRRKQDRIVVMERLLSEERESIREHLRENVLLKEQLSQKDDQIKHLQQELARWSEKDYVGVCKMRSNPI